MRPDIDRARERFLGDGDLEPAGVVRREIADSWVRSRLAGLDASRLEVPYEADIVPDPRTDVPLCIPYGPRHTPEGLSPDGAESSEYG